MTKKITSGLNIGALLLVHDEVDEAVRCFNSFTQFYDASKITILCNIKENKEYLRVKTGQIIGDWPDYVTKLISLNSGPREQQVELRMDFYREYLTSIYDAYKNIDANYLMFLHPDHKIIRPFKTNEVLAEIEYSPVNFYDEETDDALRKVLGFERTISGYGLPSYYQKTSLIKALEFMLDDSSKTLRALVAIDFKFNYGDYAIPLIFNYLGSTSDDKNLLRELSRRRRFVHFFKNPVLHHKVPKIRKSND
jgi:hypothetical protein